MQDFLYHNGQLVVEKCGDVLITRERGRYVSAPILHPEPSYNPEFEDEVNEWLDPYAEEERRPHFRAEMDLITLAEDPFERE